MKLIIEVPVPKEFTRELRIADQIDHDPEGMLRIYHAIMESDPAHRVSLRVQYDQVQR